MYCPPESGNIEPNSANAKQAQSEISAPNTHTSRNSTGCGNGPAISFAVRKIDDPMMPLTSSSTESSRPSPRTSVGFESGAFDLGLSKFDELASGIGKTGTGVTYPIPSSSDDSSAVPQRRQITEEQSPQVSGSVTSSAQFGQ